MKQANCRGWIAYILGTVYTIIFGCCVLFIIIADPNSDDIGNNMFICYSVCYIVMLILYSWIILFLHQKLDKLTIDGLLTQKRSVRIQFLFFFIAQVLKSAYYIIATQIPNENYFSAVLVGNIINPVWNSFPITYVLYEHHKAFRS